MNIPKPWTKPTTPTPERADIALERLLTDRFSCRAFRPEFVPRDVIKRILRLAQRAPSWHNSQAWQLIITSGTRTERFRKGLLEAAEAGEPNPDIAMPVEYGDVYLQRRREAGFGLYNAIGIARDDLTARHAQLMQNFRLFGAPHVAIVTSDRQLGSYGYVDRFVRVRISSGRAEPGGGGDRSGGDRNVLGLRSHSL